MMLEQRRVGQLHPVIRESLAKLAAVKDTGRQRWQVRPTAASSVGLSILPGCRATTRTLSKQECRNRVHAAVRLGPNPMDARIHQDLARSDPIDDPWFISAGRREASRGVGLSRDSSPNSNVVPTMS